MTIIDVAVGVVKDGEGRILIAKRKAHVHQGGLWEFPGGKIESLEGSEQALKRELYEELNIVSLSSVPLINIKFSYPECNVHLHVREVCEFDGEPIGREGQVCRWVTLDEIGRYDFPAANKAILSAIKLGRHYAIIGGEDAQQVMQQLESVFEQGVKLVQIRVKSLSKQQAEVILKELRIKCEVLGISYLLNSQMPVSRSLNEGLHLTSMDLMRLTERPEGSAMIAASCHSLEELHKAELLGLDFAVLSPVMETSSHPEAKALGWQQLTEWLTEVNIPVFALGGMTRQDSKKAIKCGAQGISGISLYVEGA